MTAVIISVCCVCVCSAQVGVVVVGQTRADLGLITSATPRAAELFGYSTRDMVGQNVQMLLPEPLASQHQGFMDAYLNTGNSVS